MNTPLIFEETMQRGNRIEDKRLVNAREVDVNQLVPIKYSWAWEHYLNGSNNHWMPAEVPMGRDIEQWHSDELSEAEKLLILRNLGFFSTAESLVANNLVLAIFRHVTNPECRQYLLRQALEEAIHTHAFQYICESLSLDERGVFNMYHEIPTIKQKNEFEMRLTEDVIRSDFTTETPEGLGRFIDNLVGFYVIMEGIFFYSGFAMFLSFHRRNKMTGVGQQIQYILRDETIHLNFGIDLINGIKEENPHVWNDALKARIIDNIKQAVEHEIAYAEDCLQGGVVGFNAHQFRDYVGYIADRRLERIGLPAQYHTKNPFPWMSETIDLGKEKNFFETTVTEYQNGSALKWE